MRAVQFDPNQYNHQIIRISARKISQSDLLFKAHFKDKSPSRWVTMSEIPPKILTAFYVKRFQQRQNRKLQQDFL